MSAARLRGDRGSDLAIRLISPGDDLVIRPRLYETTPGLMRVPLARVLDPIDVVRLPATAVAIDTQARGVTVVDRAGRTRQLAYDRMVLAAGSCLRRPGMPGAEHLHDVDTMAGAVGLEDHLRGLPSRPAGRGRFTAVVVGAGFTGLEVACELVDRLRTTAGGRVDEVRVVLVQRAASISPELGEGPRPTIVAALRELGVEVVLNATLSSVTATGVRLTDGGEIPAHTTIWTAGMAASPLTRQIPGRYDALGRIYVDRNLRAPEAPEVFVAGDAAAAKTESGELTLQSCQYAIPLGRYAGHNAAADLLGARPLPFSPEPYTTCLDLGSAGAVFTRGFERVVRMSGRSAKDLKREINQVRIYPPVDDPAAILYAGDPSRTWAQSGPEAALAVARSGNRRIS
jgi:NADH dehydrogenase